MKYRRLPTWPFSRRSKPEEGTKDGPTKVRHGMQRIYSLSQARHRLPVPFQGRYTTKRMGRVLVEGGQANDDSGSLEVKSKVKEKRRFDTATGLITSTISGPSEPRLVLKRIHIFTPTCNKPMIISQCFTARR
jgi:hypothetical protein